MSAGGGVRLIDAAEPVRVLTGTGLCRPARLFRPAVPAAAREPAARSRPGHRAGAGRR
ncbi:hypothetical protein [Actinoplanes sp. NBRC 101535]|uniref:hypothetical protein n=1 Tax=Actinoplanes sp. NBRC 101535 TaxID=3032196 RepID=UPI0025526BEF|nr:hypothetical protein [Actinoplanes sp. NBRC 101535]